MRFIAILGFFFLVTPACGLASEGTTKPAPSAALEAAVERASEQSGAAGLIVYVDAPGLNQPFLRSVPGADGAVINPDSVFRIASNTKTFLAVAVLRLVEQGQLELDAPISQSLPVDLQDLLIEAGFDVEAITIADLLTHKAGLPDHAQLPQYFEAIMADPDRLWSAREQVALAMSVALDDRPTYGEFTYSDTGYILLGAIVENVHGAPLAESVRALSGMDELALSATWWEALEPAPDPAPPLLAQVAFGLSLWDINPSVDLYGGGGLISSVSDLAHYHRAAVRGDLFDDPATLDHLRSPDSDSVPRGGARYGMGVFVRRIEGELCYTHSGFWGTFAMHCPQPDITMTGVVSDASGFSALYPFARAAIKAVR